MNFGINETQLDRQIFFQTRVMTFLGTQFKQMDWRRFVLIIVNSVFDIQIVRLKTKHCKIKHGGVKMVAVTTIIKNNIFKCWWTNVIKYVEHAKIKTYTIQNSSFICLWHFDEFSVTFQIYFSNLKFRSSNETNGWCTYFQFFGQLFQFKFQTMLCDTTNLNLTCSIPQFTDLKMVTFYFSKNGNKFK